MMPVLLHHVSLVVSDLQRSATFYEDMFGLERMVRPPLRSEGVWLSCGPSLQLHLIRNPVGSFRSGPVDSGDVHFALRTDDFEGMLERLEAAGFSADAPVESPMRMLVNRSGRVGFLQLYVLDPDRHIVEINSAS
jgi:glyoxylase I family protein